MDNLSDIIDNESDKTKPILYEIGKELIKKYNLKDFRVVFSYDFDLKNIEMMNYFLINTLNILPESIDNIEIIHKTINEKGLKYHIDDCQIIKKKSEPEYRKEQFIKIAKNKYLYFNTSNGKLPKKTILFYSSTYNVDFTGGVLHFSDDYVFYPKKNIGIMFDSREVHMVTPVTSGIRPVTVVKIY
jgi:hypothetical protein